MDYTSKNNLILEGQSILNKGVFPDSLLIEIKDKRLRKEVSEKIFYQKHVKFDNLSQEEQKVRKLRLDVKLKFIDYLQSYMLFSNVSYLLIIIGVLTWFTSFVGINSNAIFGISSMLLGAFLFIISFSKERIVSLTPIAFIAYSVATCLEPIFFGFPERYLSLEGEVTVSLSIAILNEVSPYVYVAIRLAVVGILFNVKSSQLKFKSAKELFEDART